MPEADAEDWLPARCCPYEVAEDPGVAGSAGPGRQQDRVGPDVERLPDAQLVIAVHDWFRAEFPEVLNEVVDEAVVVVDDEHA